MARTNPPSDSSVGQNSKMQIALVRHGRPEVDSPRVPADGLPAWVRAYDRAGIDPSHPPPSALGALASAAEHLVSSDLPRAIESLRTLAPDHRAPGERIFREAGFPGLPAIPIHLDPQFWATAARVAWFLGWSRSTEGLAPARSRAGSAARQLAALAEAHGSVLLVGHGIFNALIAWELRAASWQGPFWPTGAYWSTAVYRKAAA